MITQFTSKYKFFSDAIIKRIEYINDIDNAKCTLDIRAYNWETNRFDDFSFTFMDCIFFKFFESIKINSTVISNALLKQENDIITFDLFPLYFSENKIEENINSDFIIKCKKIVFALS